jgi:sugar transferase (PEP-CTERM system associated)
MPRIGGQTVPKRLLLLVLVDSVSIAIALSAAMYFRSSEAGWAVDFNFLTLARFALVIVVCELTLYFNDLYVFEVVRRRSTLTTHLVNALGITCLILAVLYYVAPSLQLGRGITLFAAPMILALILSWRLSLHASGLLARGSERVLIVGTANTGVTLAREILAHPEYNLRVIGFLDERRDNLGQTIADCAILGSVSQLEEVAAREKINHVVISLADRRGTTPARALMRLKFSGVQVDDAHSLFERLLGTIVVDNLSPSWLILSDGFRKSSILMAGKRILDLFFAALLLLLLSPIILLAALAIYLDSGVPILFRQTRVGQGGRPFEILKFRSMRADAEASGPQWAANSDARVTRVGKFLRTYRLDEIPQLFNVLRGDMSLVGPRPERPEFTEMLEQKISFFGLRHTVPPGLTGWAQIKYPYGASVEDSKRKLELDLFYIKHLAISLDLAIIFETAKVVLLGRGAK